MPHPQDVAVPSLPEPLTWRWTNSETGGHGFHPIKGHGNPRFAHIYTWDAVFTADQMNTRWLEGYEAGRAAGRASAEPEGWRSALKFYADGCHFTVSDETAWDTVSGEPQNFWCDEEGTATVEDGSVAARALAGDPLPDEDEAAAPTPTASIAPKAEGEAVALAASGPKYNPVWAELYPCGDSWHGIDADGDGVMMTEGEFNESVRLGATVGDPDRRAAPVAQAAAGEISDDQIIAAHDALFELAAPEEQKPRILALARAVLALSPRPEADADRASGIHNRSAT